MRTWQEAHTKAVSWSLVFLAGVVALLLNASSTPVSAATCSTGYKYGYQMTTATNYRGVGGYIHPLVTTI
jgi:hypothetical protein